MTKVQSFPWAEPLQHSVTETPTAEEQVIATLAALQTELEQLSPESRQLLLAPYLEQSLASHKANLEAGWLAQMKTQQEEKVKQAIEEIKLQVQQEEDKRRNEVELLVGKFAAPDIKIPEDNTKQVLSFALVIAEKILAQKISRDSCYESWVESIVNASRGHYIPTLHISQKDFDALQEYGLIEKLKERIGQVHVKDIDRFSFVLDSNHGQSGHDSRAILNTLTTWLSMEGDLSD